MNKQSLILVANIGSTSFKFRLFEMPSERLLARGGVERIGVGGSPWSLRIGDDEPEIGNGVFADYGAAVDHFRTRLTGRVVERFEDITAFAFKTVMASGVSGTQMLDEKVLAAMEEISPVCPAHNPPYIQAIRDFQRLYPTTPCVGMFETAFYDRVPRRNLRFPIPLKWEKEYGVRRYGFHGASHRFVTERLAEIKGRKELRIISCHLGGSSSIACVNAGEAVDSSWGMTAQSGLPHNNRVGDFDSFALLYVLDKFGLTTAQAAAELSREGGLKGMSGLDSGDMRDLLAASAQGNDDARTAIEVFVGAIRKYIGQFLVELNGADAIIFTAGIGENNPELRAAVCADLDFAGIRLDPETNAATRSSESLISAPDSKTEVWVLPTNEEIVVARSAFNKLQSFSPEP